MCVLVIRHQGSVWRVYVSGIPGPALVLRFSVRHRRSESRFLGSVPGIWGPTTFQGLVLVLVLLFCRPVMDTQRPTMGTQPLTASFRWVEIWVWGPSMCWCLGDGNHLTGFNTSFPLNELPTGITAESQCRSLTSLGVGGMGITRRSLTAWKASGVVSTAK